MKKIDKQDIFTKKTLMVNVVIEAVLFLTYFVLIFVQPRRNFYYVSLAGILIYVILIGLTVFFYYKKKHQVAVRRLVTGFFFFQTAYLIAYLVSYAPAIGRMTLQFYVYLVYCIISFLMFLSVILQHAGYNILLRRKILDGFALIVFLFMGTSIFNIVLIIIDFVKYGFTIEYFLTLLSNIVYVFGTDVAALIEYYYYKIDDAEYYLSLNKPSKTKTNKK